MVATNIVTITITVTITMTATMIKNMITSMNFFESMTRAWLLILKESNKN